MFGHRAQSKTGLCMRLAAAALVPVALFLLLLQSLPATAAISFIEPVPALVTAATGKGAVALATADFNGDGEPDLAVIYFDDLGLGAGTQDFVVLMLGNGDGSFQPPTTIYTVPPGLTAGAILAKDFDGDGKIDLAVGVTGASNQILWFKGHGDGSFDAPLSTSTNFGAHGLQTADLNHDGILDLVALNSQDASVSVLLGVGDGTFQPPADYLIGTNPLDVAIGDVDGINGPDIVVGNYDTATIGVLLNHGDGTFGAMTSFAANMSPGGLYLADFDGDGKLDVVAAGTNCNGGNFDARGCIVFMKGDGTGSFATPTSADFTGVDSTPVRRHQIENAAPDLNGDGKPDVIFVLAPALPLTFGNSQILVGLSNGDGTFSIGYWVGALPQASPHNSDIITAIAAVAGDFDQDGVLDLAFAFQGKVDRLSPTQVLQLTRGGVSILFGDKPGTFEAPRSYAANYKGFSPGPPFRAGALGDFTGDGNIDLVVVNALTDNLVASPILETFIGNGDGSFQDAITALAWNPAQSGGSSTLRAADLDKNGTLDVVFFGPHSGVVASGNGDGTFTNFSSFGYTAGSPMNMVIADFDGDGYPDLAIFENGGCVSGNAVTSIEVLLQGAGGTKTFASKSITQVNGGCGGGWAMVAGDFDKDGKIDLVVTRFNNTTGWADVMLLKGNGDGTFAKPKSVATVQNVFATGCDYAAADLRRSGNLDLIGIDEGVLHVLLGNGNGTFQASGGYGLQGGIPTECEIKVADFDGDGIPDIAVVHNPGAVPFCCVLGGSFQVLHGNGDGTFQPPVMFAIGISGGGWLDVADLNGDGLPDIVVGHAGVNGNGYTVLVNSSPPPPTADLAISKSDSPDPVSIGPLTYTITVTNNGPDTANGITMTDPLPVTVFLVSATASQGNCNGTTIVICNLGTLSNGSSATVTIVVVPLQVGGISNTASVTANELDPKPSNNSATQVTTINSVGRYVTGLSPAKLWVGQNGTNRKLTYDLLAEVLVNGSTVGTGQLSNVKAGKGAAFNGALLDSITLGLNALAAAVPAGADFSIRVSVRVSCAAAASGVSSIARLWYNGQPIDTGRNTRDAGSRFDATIGGTNSNYFLLPAFALSTTAGNAKQFIDVPVNDQSACPARPFTPFGTWNVNLP